MKHILICNPENRRTKFFLDALRRESPLIRTSTTVIAIEDILAGKVQLENAIEPESLIRIESPGENLEVRKLLIALGECSGDNGCHEKVSAQVVLNSKVEHGRIRYSRQWYLGFCKFLQSLQSQAELADDVRFYIPPKDIAIMFDKRECQEFLHSNDVTVPPWLVPVKCFDELVENVRQENWKGAFIKLRHGSSASGVIALHFSQCNFKAITSMELERRGDCVAFFNNLKVRTYDQLRDVKSLVNFVLSEGGHVEQWLPKASHNRLGFDLRVVVIGGRATHVVARASKSPITNLHLGNQRSDLDAIRLRMGESKWRCALNTAEKAAKSFPNSLYMGVDILLGPGFANPTVLEINAFGDLLPGVVHESNSTYETELMAAMSIQSKGSGRPDPFG